MKRAILAALMVFGFSVFANGKCLAPTTDSRDCNPKDLPQIPVLMYHRVIADMTASDTVISPRIFTQHIAVLVKNGYTTVTVSQVAAYMRGEITLPEKSIALTFDDGWADNMDASEILRLNGMTGTFYIITNAFDDPQYLNEDQVRNISKTNEIGSHSQSHFMAYASSLSSLPSSLILKEFYDSRAILEFIIGKPVVSMAWPFGYNLPELNKDLEEMGYTSAVLIYTESQNPIGNPAMGIHRLIINGGCTDIHLLEMLQTGKEGSCE